MRDNATLSVVDDVGPLGSGTMPSQATPAPFPRRSARVLLLDETDRLLLFSSRNASDGSTR